MGWGSTIGLALLTAFEGALLAFALSQFLISFLQISNFEGGAGYFTVFVITGGVIGGFVVGLITALAVRSGFWTAQVWSVGISAGLTVLVGLAVVIFDDNGPKIDGESVVAEVELKFPSDWKPDNKAKFSSGSFCWLQYKAEDGSQQVNPVFGAGLNLKQVDGGWVATCSADLGKTTRNRYLRVFVGNSTDVTIQMPLPRSPGAKNQEWSGWTSSGLLPQAATPVPAGYTFRCRVQKDTDYKTGHPDPSEVFRKAWARKFDSIPEDAPVARWLPMFEDDHRKPTSTIPGGHPEVKAVNAKAMELAPLLRSGDQNVVRQAVFAAATLEHPPQELIQPLAEAGRRTIGLIRTAKAGALPKDPDLVAEEKAFMFFCYWSIAMGHAGDAANSAYRAVLKEIEPEATGSSGSDGIQLIANQVQRDLKTPTP